jgi:hypothetical protein
VSEKLNRLDLLWRGFVRRHRSLSVLSPDD